VHRRSDVLDGEPPPIVPSHFTLLPCRRFAKGPQKGSKSSENRSCPGGAGDQTRQTSPADRSITPNFRDS